VVINEKALVRKMKEAYNDAGYTVVVGDSDTWVIRGHSWAAVISGANNVPRKALALMALHMGFLPEHESAYRVYKTDTGPLVQKEVFDVAIEPILALEGMRKAAGTGAERVLRSKLMFGVYRVWQQPVSMEILLIAPKDEDILENKKNVQKVGNALYAHGEISYVYVMRYHDDADKLQIDHLAQMQWVEE